VIRIVEPFRLARESGGETSWAGSFTSTSAPSYFGIRAFSTSVLIHLAPGASSAMRVAGNRLSPRAHTRPMADDDRGGKMLEQSQVVVMHIEGGKIAEVWLHFSDQQAMDEFASS